MNHQPVFLGVLLLAAVAILGHLVGRAVLPDRRLPAVTVALLPIAGLALVALQLLLYGAARIPWFPPLVLAPWLVLGAARRRAFAAALRADLAGARAGAGAVWSAGPAGLALAVAVLLAISADAVLQVAAPMLAWDAVALWMLKAKLFYLGHTFALAGPLGDESRRLDYPPLLPGLVGTIYVFAGGVAESVGKAVNAIFLAVMALTVAAGLRPRAGTRAALLWTLAAVSSPLLIPFLSCSCLLGYADFAEAVLIVSALAHLAAVEAGDGRAAPGAVLAAALAALVKNEGLVLLAAVVAALALLPSGRRALRPAGAWALAAAACLLAGAWQAYLRANGLKPAYVGSATGGPADLAARAWVVLRYAARAARDVPEYRWLGAALVVAAILLAVSGRGRRAALLVLGVQMAGYVAAYAVTPFPLEWQLGTSFDRLVAQVVPGTVFVLGLAAAPLLPHLMRRPGAG